MSGNFSLPAGSGAFGAFGSMTNMPLVKLSGLELDGCQERGSGGIPDDGFERAWTRIGEVAARIVSEGASFKADRVSFSGRARPVSAISQEDEDETSRRWFHLGLASRLRANLLRGSTVGFPSRLT